MSAHAWTLDPDILVGKRIVHQRRCSACRRSECTANGPTWEKCPRSHDHRCDCFTSHAYGAGCGCACHPHGIRNRRAAETVGG